MERYTGAVYEQHRDRYYKDMETYVDQTGFAKDERWLYPCENKYLRDESAKGMVEGMLESILDEHHEDAHEEIFFEDELIHMVEDWLKKQTIVSWFPLYKKRVKVPCNEEELNTLQVEDNP